MKKTILIVDDEADIRNLVKEILEDEGYATLTAANSKEVYELLENGKPDMAVLDIWLQDSRHDGLQILETIKASEHAAIPVIMISGHGTIETAVSAIKSGAYDFIEKPFKSDRLLLMVKRGLEAAGLAQENAVLRAQSQLDVQLVGGSTYVKNLKERIGELAASNSRTLIKGPLGVGKSTVARLIHNQSARVNEPFLTRSCVSVEGGDVELAQYFADAKDGTIVLQEVCGLSPADQRGLLALLQNNDYSARVIATVRDACALDQNLYQRLAVENVELLPLAQRAEDVGAFSAYFLSSICREFGLGDLAFSRDALAILARYNWPGNLHEMQAIVALAVIQYLEQGSGTDTVAVSCLPQHIGGDHTAGHDNVEVLHATQSKVGGEMLELSLREARDVFEREYLTSQVERFEGNISKTAQFIGMERSALHRKIKSLQSKEDKDDASKPHVAAGNN